MEKGESSNLNLKDRNMEEDWINSISSSNDDYNEIEIEYGTDISSTSTDGITDREVIATANDKEKGVEVNELAPSSATNSEIAACSNSMTEKLVPDNMMPQMGDTYSNLTEAIETYRKYAYKTGFGIRMGTENVNTVTDLHSRYVRCNRYGQPRNEQGTVSIDPSATTKQRKSSSKASGCKAGITFHKIPKTNTYKVSSFEPEHNHSLLPSNDPRNPLNTKRVTYMDRDFIMKASTLNIGATRAYKLKACFKGGFHKFLTTKNAFKNFWRDFTNIIGPRDAQWVVDQFNIRKKTYSKFYFEYKLKGTVLNGLFWADEQAQINYKLYSEVISMDATYRTNKYNLIFVPFTAINNHGKTVNIGAGLLADETIESYSWLLERFLEAHGHAPNMIMSDQDPALNQSISRVLPQSTHRLCMWHIMQKMQGKVSADILKKTPFRQDINKLVWTIHMDIEEFEMKWLGLISKYKLEENKWLDDMYQIRDKWIPAYFRHIPMCGLMKTTSRSESANSFFNVFTNNDSLLVNFMFNFDTAITTQRYEQDEMDKSSATTTPKLFANTYNKDIENHAANIYTRAIFLKVQKEIKKATSICYQETSYMYEDLKECIIVFRNPKVEERPRFRVRVNDTYSLVDCSCRCFNNFGYLCCHALNVLINHDVKKIPEKYIAKRWQKDIIEISQCKTRQRWGVFENQKTQKVEEASTHFENCVDKAVHDDAKLDELIRVIKELDLKFEGSVGPSTVEDDTREFVEEIIGTQLTTPAEIENPPDIINKGGSLNLQFDFFDADC